MPPKQASNISEDVKKGMKKMFTFFKPVPAPPTPTIAGRKKRHAGGRPSTSTVAGGAPPVPPVPPPPPALPVASNDAVPEPAAKKAKKRANYDVPGLHKDRMDAAVDEWVNGVKPEDFATGKEMSLNKFAESKRLPPSSFFKKVSAYKAARLLSAKRSRGKPSVVSYDKKVFIVDAIVRADRANNGMTSGSIHEMVGTLCPTLSLKQCKCAFKKIKQQPEFKARLTGVVRAQKSTTKRSGITIEQQYRWHKVLVQPEIYHNFLKSFTTKISLLCCLYI